MKIKEIDLKQIRDGTRWRLAKEVDFEEPMEEWSIVDADRFSAEDEVVYSGVAVLETGIVYPLVMVKEVGSGDYGGDYCEYRKGRWRQLGLEIEPDAPNQQVYIADPLPQDPSFHDGSGPESRAWNTENFRRFVVRIEAK